MSLDHAFDALNRSGALSFVIVLPAAVLAVILAWLDKGARSRNSYITYLLEAVTIEASLVIILSAFNARVLAWLGNNTVFLSIVAMTTLLYALRDMFDRVRRVSTQEQRKDNV